VTFESGTDVRDGHDKGRTGQGDLRGDECRYAKQLRGVLTVGKANKNDLEPDDARLLHGKEAVGVVGCNIQALQNCHTD
jgi:hypothetical protein